MIESPKTHPNYFHQYIQHKALSFKFLDGNDKLLDKIIEEENSPLIFKNVCAKLPEQLVDRLDGTCGMLQLSKRKFVELAIIEALDRCDAIIQEIDPFEFCLEVEEVPHTMESLNLKPAEDLSL
jgi:hypothetical protein